MIPIRLVKFRELWSSNPEILWLICMVMGERRLKYVVRIGF